MAAALAARCDVRERALNLRCTIVWRGCVSSHIYGAVGCGSECGQRALLTC